MLKKIVAFATDYMVVLLAWHVPEAAGFNAGG